MNELFRDGLERNATANRRKYLEYADDLLTLISIHCILEVLNNSLQEGENAADIFWGWLSAISKSVDANAPTAENFLQIHKFVFVKYFTIWIGSTVREFVTNRLGDDAYARLFQRYGQMLR